MKVFFSYSHKDETLRDELEKHLAILKRDGHIATWHDRRILAGSDFDNEIDEELVSSDITLLLVSPNFLASEYCYTREMKKAMERHERKETHVIPIILEHCDWLNTPLGKLMALPQDGKPISDYTNPNKAFMEVVVAIRQIINEKNKSTIGSFSEEKTLNDNGKTDVIVSEPRSANLRVPKTFTDRDRDKYCQDAFQYIKRYFRNSLSELESRNERLDTDIQENDANTFTVKVYRDGHQSASCQVRLENSRLQKRQILYSYNEISSGYNAALSVSDDGYQLQLTPMISFGEHDGPFSFEGAAEHYWSMLIEQLRRM